MSLSRHGEPFDSGQQIFELNVDGVTDALVMWRIANARCLTQRKTCFTTQLPADIGEAAGVDEGD
jgi:hypothetical protein